MGSKTIFKTSNPIFGVSIALALYVILSAGIFLVVRDILPTVMQDELVYREDSRIGKDGSLDLPNYLFFRLYSLTDYLGEDFYLGVKALNVFFHAASAFLLFSWARAKLELLPALFVGISFLVSPFASFTTFFMPEPLYSFLVLISLYLFSLALTENRESLDKSFWLLIVSAGLVLALAQLSKPHGLFILAALLAYVFIFVRQKSLVVRFVVAGALLASFLISRFVVGFLLAGYQTFDIFGVYFGDPENPSEASTTDLILGNFPALILGNFPALIGNSFLNLGQHILTVGFILGPLIFFFLARKAAPSKLFVMLLFVAFVVAVFISGFESYITVIGDNHLERVLLRHYEWLIPAIWLAFLISFQEQSGGIKRERFSSALAVFLSFIGYMVIALTEGLFWDASGAADSGFTSALRDPIAMWAWVLLAIVFLLLFVRKDAVSVRSVAAVMVLASSVAGVQSMRLVYNENSNPLPSDLSGIYVNENLEDVAGDKILVIGSDKALAEASIFQMNKPGVEYILFNPGTIVDPADAIGTYDIVVQQTGVFLYEMEKYSVSSEGYAITDLRLLED